jgi:CRISPR type I-A-associated protein Csa5
MAPEKVGEEYGEIVDVLGVFARMGAYGLVDRIAGALTPEAVEHALYDAMRSLNALMRQAAVIKIEDRDRPVKIVDWTEKLDDPKYQLAEEGKVVEVIEGPFELRGKRIRYIRVPDYLPSQEKLNNFVSQVREKGFEGLSLARRIALLALTPYRRG